MCAGGCSRPQTWPGTGGRDSSGTREGDIGPDGAVRSTNEQTNDNDDDDNEDNDDDDDDDSDDDDDYDEPARCLPPRGAGGVSGETRTTKGSSGRKGQWGGFFGDGKQPHTLDGSGGCWG